MSPEYGSEPPSQPLATAAAEHHSEQVVSDALELVDCESDKRPGESKLSVETGDISTSAGQSAGSCETVDGQIIEPLPETKKGWFCNFCIYENYFGLI